ncbi:tetratricopeptide repeat protein [Nonlabens marinus]|nr:tetratricopeptide repeat protein [Nonlabens marinus]
MKQKNHKILFAVLIFTSNLIAYAQIQVGDSLMEVGDYKGAIEMYSSLEDSSGHVRFKMARAYTATGNTGKAIKAYQQGLKVEATGARPRYELGRLYLSNNQPIQALLIFRKLREEFPENATYAFYYGQGLEKIKAEDQAMDVYENVLALDPDYRNARMELVVLLIKKRETAQAIKLAKEELQKNPEDIKFNSLIAQAYFQAKIYSKTIEHLEKLFELGNDTDYNRRTLGMAYFEDTQWEKAIENFDVFLKQYDDKDAALYFAKSRAHLKLREYDKSQDAIEYAIMLRRPVLHLEYLQLSAIMAAQEDYKGTFDAMKLAYEENGEDPIIAYQLAVAADRYFEDKKTILTYYERYLNKFGSDNTYGDYASARASDLKKELFMSPDN